MCEPNPSCTLMVDAVIVMITTQHVSDKTRGVVVWGGLHKYSAPACLQNLAEYKGLVPKHVRDRLPEEPLHSLQGMLALTCSNKAVQRLLTGSLLCPKSSAKGQHSDFPSMLTVCGGNKGS